MEYSLGLLANCASYCSMNVHLLSQLGGEAVLRQLQYDERALTSPDQRERIPELVKELLRYLSFRFVCLCGRGSDMHMHVYMHM